MTILDKIYLKNLKKTLLDYDSMRREVIKLSGDAQYLAKRAIFSYQRNEIKEAQDKLSLARKILVNLGSMAKKDKRVLNEGAYHEAVEEFVEAELFGQFVCNKKIGKIASINVEPESYIAGLCDVPGELQRYAIRAATLKDTKTVKKCFDVAEEIIGELVEYNLTKYLRTKFDQAKQALSRIEVIVYELSLRSK